MDDGKLDARDNGHHDAENAIDPEVAGDPERVRSGKLSESSGYAGSDLYDYKVFIFLSNLFSILDLFYPHFL